MTNDNTPAETKHPMSLLRPNDELHEGTGMKLSTLPSFKQELPVNPVGPTGRWFSARSKISPGMRDELPGRLSGLRIFELKPKVNSSRQM